MNRKKLLFFLYMFVLISVCFFFCSFFNTKFGKPADWLEVSGTIGALLFAYQEILDSRIKFKQEHKSKLRVYVTYKDLIILNTAHVTIKGKGKEKLTSLSAPTPQLHIVPVNVGLSAGIYRYFGICKQDDIKRIKDLMEKASNSQLKNAEVNEIAHLISYDAEDIGESESEHDMVGMNLVYPKDKEVFESIGPNNVGNIIDKPINKIEKDLRIKLNQDKIEVIFVDPNMKVYNFSFGPFKKEKQMVELNFPSKSN